MNVCAHAVASYWSSLDNPLFRCPFFSYLLLINPIRSDMVPLELALDLNFTISDSIYLEFYRNNFAQCIAIEHSRLKSLRARIIWLAWYLIFASYVYSPHHVQTFPLFCFPWPSCIIQEGPIERWVFFFFNAQALCRAPHTQTQRSLF